MSSILVKATVAAIAFLGSFEGALSKDSWVGQLSCDLTDRPHTFQNRNLEITCVFFPNHLKVHRYYMGNYAVRTGVAKAPAGVMRWEAYTSLPASFKGLGGKYVLNQTLSRPGKRPASAVLSGGDAGTVSLRPVQGHFNKERNFAGHVSALTLVWGGAPD